MLLEKVNVKQIENEISFLIKKKNKIINLKVKSGKWPDYGLNLKSDEFFNLFLHEKKNKDGVKDKNFKNNTLF